MDKNTPTHDHGILKKFLFFLKFLEIRLRFVLILVITALVVGYWDNIQNYYERWQRNRAAATGHSHEAAATESQFEFFCPMHPFVVRDHKDKCPICGMDLVERRKGAPATLPAGTLARVQVSPDRIMQAGIQVEPAGYRLLTRTVRTYGVIEPDETRMAKIVARFPGRIDKLTVNAVGMVVKKGEPLAQIYSPKYLSAAQEYIQALKSEQRAGQASAEERQRATQITAYARQRLLLAGFTEAQLDEIKADGKLRDTVTLYAPLAGTVLEKNALLGETVQEETALYTIADLSKVWIQAQTMEADVSAVHQGMPVEVSSVSYPGEIFYGTVDFVYPTVSAENRSVKVRVVVDNAAAKLKPGMYVSAVMRSPVGRYGDADKIKIDEPVKAAAKSNIPKLSAVKHVAETKPARVKPAKLPTETQADADAFLASLKPGADYYQCAMDLEVVSDKPDDCPKCGMRLEKRQKEQAAPAGHAAHLAVHDVEGPEKASTERWAEGYSCAMHPDELSPEPGVCTVCGCGMKLVRTLVERVLAVPEKAVIDTGTRMVVYVETAPGVYDSRALKLGPRAGAWYPVLEGLKPGDRIVSQGSFLIDAEARLNPAAAAPSGEGQAGEGQSSGGHQHGGA